MESLETAGSEAGLEFQKENISLATFANDLFATSSESTYEASTNFYSPEDGNSTISSLTNISSTHVFHSNEIVIIDRPEVRWLFITLYTIVFCSCFFGNLMVILVVTLHWRMRSITNFCLANLAFADLCVGIFCVYQNIIYYMMDSWIFGEFMCKMYHFISSLSTTASILILVVICIERYLAIIHPMRCKQMLTLNRLRVTIIGVWVLSALISSPRFHYFTTMPMPHENGEDILCVPNRTKYNSKMADMISMGLLFLAPLVVITVLYFQIGVALWKSSKGRMPSASTSADSSSSSCRECESTATNTANNHPLNSFASNHVSMGHKSRENRSFLQRLNCTKTKKESRSSRHRRTCGSFYGTDKLIYKTVNPPNTTMNGGHNGSIPQGPTGERRNTNGLHISCNGNSLQPITPSSTLHSTNGCPSLACESPLTSSSKLSLKCCGCRKIIQNSSHGTDSVPVSPYLKRDSSSNLSSPPPAPLVSISSTEPIVLVKFEKKCHKKCKRNKCTVLIRSAMPTENGNGRGGSNSGDEGVEGCGVEKVELSNLSSNPYLLTSSGGGGGGRLDCGSSIGSTCTLAASSAATLLSEGSCCGCCSCSTGELSGSTMIAYCQLCSKKDGKNRGTQHSGDAHSGFAAGHHGILSNSVEGRCDKNLDCISHFGVKDSIPTPNSHQTTSFGSNQHCAQSVTTPTCLGHHHNHHHHHHLHPGTSSVPISSSISHTVSTTYSNFKSPAKGPKRMRVIRSSKYGTTALQRRRRIIRMLIVIVVAFAMCHLPFHARKIWQYWGHGYNAASVFSQLFTPITFLIMYAQSGINPILYAFMSRKFRSSFADLLCCNMRRSLKVSRNFSVRSTNAIQLSQTT